MPAVRRLPSGAKTPPYPPSPVVASISWDYSRMDRKAQGSDIWPLTWADDGNLYSAWGDGWGFSNTGEKLSLGVSRIEGMPGSYTGTDLWSAVGKSDAIISINGTLYMMVTEQDSWMRGKLGWSTDHGQTWTFDPNWTFAEKGGVFAAPGYLQFGKDYQGARDNYVYGYSEKVRETIQPDMVMFRVPKDKLPQRSAYEFFAGLDGNGSPRWTSDINQMKPVFSDRNGVGWGVEAAYNPVLKRYFMTVYHDETGGWGIFDAPEPWGPWTTVAYYDHWIDSTFKFAFSFNQKWMSSDGKTMWMSFSGLDAYDSFNLIKGTLKTR
ncbi:MAG TPA: DUF4185 domain-containing protein [Anaerolineales bacterium]